MILSLMSALHFSKYSVKKSYHILILFCLLFIATFVFLVPDAKQVMLQHPEIDTIGHFISFILFTWLLHTLLKLPLVPLTVALIFYSGASEVGQYYLGYRNGEFTDFFANIAGIFTYLGFRWLRFIYKYSK